jgi:hypothetical protein
LALTRLHYTRQVNYIKGITMCNSLFPVRAAAFAHHLSRIPEVVKAYNDGRTRTVLGRDDGRSRLVLSSPPLCTAIHKHYQMKDFRARLAFTGYGNGLNVPELEVYTVEGDLVRATPVSELETELCDAVHIELQHVLLISKGIDINMY